MIRPPINRVPPTSGVKQPPPVEAAPPAAPARQPSSLPFIAGGVLVVLLVVGMIGLQVMGGDRPGPEAGPGVAAALPPEPVASAPPQPSGCNPLTDELAQVNRLVQRGDYAAAVPAAEQALGQQGPCEPSKFAMARLWYQASMGALLTSPCQDEPTERRHAEQWRALKGQADRFGVPADARASAATLAREAISASCWPLARVAFQEGLQAGEFRAADTGIYYGVLREWGRHLALRTEYRQRGEQLLATAQAINRDYSLRRDEACQDLRLLGYPDCNRVPPDLTDTVLSKR